MQALVTDYFNNLFSTLGQLGNMDFLEGLTGRIYEEMKEEINKNFTTDEVYKALFQMHPTKFLGPDGMPPSFFKTHWHIVRESITKAVLDALLQVKSPMT